MTRAPVVGLLVAVTVLASVGAQEHPKADYRVYGQGALSCREWVEARRDASPTKFDAAYVYEVWMLGFVSGAGYAGLTMTGTDSQAIKTFVDQYCAGRPADNLSHAAAALIRGLRVKAP
jgi:hypothetical protein